MIPFSYELSRGLEAMRLQATSLCFSIGESSSLICIINCLPWVMPCADLEEDWAVGRGARAAGCLLQQACCDTGAARAPVTGHPFMTLNNQKRRCCTKERGPFTMYPHSREISSSLMVLNAASRLSQAYCYPHCPLNTRLQLPD